MKRNRLFLYLGVLRVNVKSIVAPAQVRTAAAAAPASAPAPATAPATAVAPGSASAPRRVDVSTCRCSKSKY